MNNTTTIYMKGFPHFLASDILLYVMSGTVFFINTIIVLMFLIQRRRRPSKTRLNPGGALVLNLFISDALVGAMGLYITATFSATGVHTASPFGCVNRITPRFFFRMGSHMALINVALDRYIAITHTLQYRDWVTMDRCLASITFGWIVPLVGTVYGYLANNWSPGLIFCYQLKSFVFFLTYIRLPCHLAAMICVVAIQLRIFLHLRNHEQSESPQYLRKYSQKSARVLFWVTTTYVLCWLPFDTILALLLFVHIPYFKILLDATVILAYASFLVNTFIFSYKTENIRKPVTDLWNDLCKAVMGEKTGTTRVSVVTAVNKRTSFYSTSSNNLSSRTASSVAISQHGDPVEGTTSYI